MYQKCPICNGVGKTHNAGFEVECTVCSGMKIISSLTGLPPHRPQTPPVTPSNYDEAIASLMDGVYKGKIDPSDHANIHVVVGDKKSVVVIEGLELVEDDEPFNYGENNDI